MLELMVLKAAPQTQLLTVFGMKLQRRLT